MHNKRMLSPPIIPSPISFLCHTSLIARKVKSPRSLCYPALIVVVVVLIVIYWILYKKLSPVMDLQSWVLKLAWCK
ncbi:predicted protein [Lichtheimia corymbifera JMRC:FSU:9682]|uniref:Uncharacterized protein n=1 Tax=Lichtheimia corymbifera JMRC:FSU:9682 TaxID=1263082 RepID=A0A068RYY7_9FUNG|nr:predicted protein [Lichtheimia corymbifera JMRC:FSU:9682]